MNIAIIGTGNMASALAQRAAPAGNTLTLIGRDPAKAATLASQTRATVAKQVPAGAELVFVATPFGEAVNALRQAGPLDGKIIVDLTNPVTPDFSALTVGHVSSAAEQIQQAFPKAKVVKAFNTIFAQLLASAAPGTVPVFVAADDAAAREQVKSFAADIGFKTIDAGPLRNARQIEPLALLNIYLGYGAGHGTAIAPTWIGL